MLSNRNWSFLLFYGVSLLSCVCLNYKVNRRYSYGRLLNPSLLIFLVPLHIAPLYYLVDYSDLGPYHSTLWCDRIWINSYLRHTSIKYQYT